MITRSRTEKHYLYLQNNRRGNDMLTRHKSKYLTFGMTSQKKSFLLGFAQKMGVGGPCPNCLALNAFLFYFFTKVERAWLISVSTAAPAVAYSFKASVLLSILILMPLLANFNHFVVYLRTFWCTFSDIYNAVVYQNWQILGMWTTWHRLHFYTNEKWVLCFGLF